MNLRFDCLKDAEAIAYFLNEYKKSLKTNIPDNVFFEGKGKFVTVYAIRTTEDKILFEEEDVELSKVGKELFYFSINSTGGLSISRTIDKYGFPHRITETFADTLPLIGYVEEYTESERVRGKVI